jgi:copper chaperone
MLTFEVKDMTCGHCVSAITKALKEVDQTAQVQVNLADKQVQIEAAHADLKTLMTAMQDAGYTPVQTHIGS